MDQNNLGPLFQITNPDYGKSETELFQEKVKRMKQQALESQIQQIENTKEQIQNTKGQKFNKTAGIAAALGQLVNPESNVFNSVINQENQKQKNNMGLQDRLTQQNRILAGTANALGDDLYRSEGLDRKKEMADYNHSLAMQRIMANKKGNEKAPENSVFGKEKMKALGKGAAEFYQKTRPQLLSNLPKINQAISIMGSDKELTGGVSDKILGSTGLSLRNEDAYEAQQHMQSAITDTLRPTLGAQFTEKEGERIMNLTFDPKVSTEENRRRALALKKAIQNKVEFQDALYQHLGENNGSDKGFDYTKYGMTKSSSGQNSGGTAFKSEKANSLAKEFGF